MARTGTAPTESPAPDLTATSVQALGSTESWTRRERLRLRWYRLRLTSREINHETRWLLELHQRLP